MTVQSPILTPTKERGAQVRPVGITYAEPAQFMTDEALDAFMPDGGMNGPFLADVMSAMLTHERCGRHLYRSVEGRTLNPMLQRRYRQFGEQTERHVELLEELITAAGGNPCYVSPMARATQGMDTKLIESTYALGGSIDVMTQEMAMLDAVLLAETIDHANWSTMAQLCEAMPEGTMRDRFQAAVDEVEAQEDEHLEWARTTKQRMIMMQAEHATLAAMTEQAEGVLAKVKGWFADDE